jgi:hypothetical protein
MNKQLEKETKRIAEAIVELVERTDGPVTFGRIEREVGGFKAKGGLEWDHLIEEQGRERIIWSGMTEAGVAALRRVLSQRSVALEHVSLVIYLVDGHLSPRAGWIPMVLLPAKDANVETERWLMRMPKGVLDSLPRAAKSCYRLLQPDAPPRLHSRS